MMARSNSPGYPNLSLPKAITAARKIFESDRRNPIDRVTAAKHIGYGGASGASDKALASLAHYGLTEKTGKGELRVSQLALDIIHPDPLNAAFAATHLLHAGLKPAIFKNLYERFGSHVSEDALRSYLIRENFQNIAINPVINAYFETCRYLEHHKAFESGGISESQEADSDIPEDDGGAADVVFGGAKVGDLIQWESGGALKLEKPTRVRLVSDDGRWVAVDGSETGIPMDEVIVEERAQAKGQAPIEAPRFKLASEPDEATKPGTRKAMFPLDEGDVTLIFPEGLSKDALADLSQYLDIFLKKEQRKSAQKTSSDGTNHAG